MAPGTSHALVPADVAECCKVHEWRNGLAILAAARPEEWANILEVLRGFALLARTAGLLGHLAEEMDQPLGMQLYREVDERATYDPPDPEG